MSFKLTRSEVRRCILQAILDAKYIEADRVAEYYSKMLVPNTPLQESSKPSVYEKYLSHLVDFLKANSIEYTEDEVGGYVCNFGYNTRYYFSYPHRRKTKFLEKAEEAFLSAHPKGKIVSAKELATKDYIQRVRVPTGLQIAGLSCCLRKSLIDLAGFIMRGNNKMTQTFIAKQFGVRNNSINSQVGKLEEIGIIYREGGKPRMSDNHKIRYMAAIKWIEEAGNADKFMSSDCGD